VVSVELRRRTAVAAAALTVAACSAGNERPIAVHGLAGADTELLRATGGKLKHARVNSGGAAITPTPAQSNVTPVAAMIVP
jgi:hypothetical protein